MADKAVIVPQVNIDSILQEQRSFEPPRNSARTPTSRVSPSTSALQGVDRRSRQVLERHCQRTALVQEVGQGARMELPVGEVVCRRPDQSFLQLPRPPRATARKNKAAIIWESEPGEIRTLTYQQLHREVQKFCQRAESRLGVKKGDRVAIYMGMTPELPIAMLACARIGAPHTIVFGGFSSNALDRPHSRFAGHGCDYAGRILSPRRGGEIIPGRRRGAESPVPA